MTEATDNRPLAADPPAKRRKVEDHLPSANVPATPENGSTVTSNVNGVKDSRPEPSPPSDAQHSNTGDPTAKDAKSEPQSKPDAKTEIKLETKTEIKTENTPDVKPESDSRAEAENDLHDRDSKQRQDEKQLGSTVPLPSDEKPAESAPEAETSAATKPSPTKASEDDPQKPVLRGPQVTGSLDEVRPPRRTEPPPESDTKRPSDEKHEPSIPSMEPTGLDPEVDKVLAQIFASGLFERKDIDGRALDFLSKVTPNLALAALEDIQRRDFSTVRNKPAFIMSIFKRVVQGGGTAPPTSAPPGGFPPTSVPESALAHLPPAVSDALQQVFSSGVCHPSQFDDRAMDILVDLAEPDAVRALSEFAAMEPGRVRNPSAFWMGLARKYKGSSRGGRVSSYDGSYGSYDGMGYDSRRMGFSASLEQRLDELSASGQLPRSMLDDRALDALRRLPEQDALGVLAELPEPSRVRNMSAYVMGLCKKFASGEARSLSGRGGSGGGSGAYPSGGYSGAYGSGAYGSAYGGAYSGYGATAVPGAYGGYGAHAGAYGQTTSYPISSGGMAEGYGQTPMPHSDGSRIREVREALESMDPAVRERFMSMSDQGIITETSFDARAIGALQSLQRDEACAALDELAASEPGRIHNISAYFMGLAKKFGRPAM